MGKTVTTYLIDADPKGTQYVFISNKICQMYVIPRSNISILNKWTELQTPAFCFCYCIRQNQAGKISNRAKGYNRKITISWSDIKTRQNKGYILQYCPKAIMNFVERKASILKRMTGERIRLCLSSCPTLQSLEKQRCRILQNY